VSAVLAASHRAMAIGSRSFAAATRLFDPETRDAARLLYAWCRHCDDVVDGQTLGRVGAAEDGGATTPPAADRLDRLYDLTRRALAGEPLDEPAFVALQWVARRHGIAAGHALALLDGFAMDVRGEPFRSLDDTLRYCYHVAGVVGLMMAQVMGVRDDATLDRACDLGLAFQLTNIARDVADDARAGRVYLPADWLAEAGLDRASVLDRPDCDAVRALRARLVATAEPYYDSAYAGVASLPFRSAWAVAAARSIYRDIGLGVRAGYDGRVVVGPSRKVARIVSAVFVAGASRALAVRAARSRDGLWCRPG
jgi:phytoene synthase